MLTLIKQKNLFLSFHWLHFPWARHSLSLTKIQTNLLEDILIHQSCRFHWWFCKYFEATAVTVFIMYSFHGYTWESPHNSVWLSEHNHCSASISTANHSDAQILRAVWMSKRGETKTWMTVICFFREHFKEDLDGCLLALILELSHSFC